MKRDGARLHYDRSFEKEPGQVVNAGWLPGWPELLLKTVSAASTRIVLIARRSSSEKVIVSCCRCGSLWESVVEVRKVNRKEEKLKAKGFISRLLDHMTHRHLRLRVGDLGLLCRTPLNTRKQGFKSFRAEWSRMEPSIRDTRSAAISMRSASLWTPMPENDARGS